MAELKGNKHALVIIDMLNDFIDEKVSKILIVTMNHVIVSYEYRAYVDVFNIYSGERIHRKQFDKPVRFMEANINAKTIYW